MEHILGKIQIMTCEGSSGIILFLASAVRKFLKFGHDQVITACPFPKRTHKIMDFPAAVNAEYHIVHFFVGKFHHLIIEQDAVCGQCKAETLVMYFFLGTSIGHKVFDYLPVHKRFPAEEIHFQILSVAGIGDQEIQRLFSHFISHHGSASMILPFFRETIAAGQVTVMGNVQAEGLHHSGPVLKAVDRFLVHILCEQHLFFFQFCTFLKSGPDIPLLVLVFQGSQDLLLTVPFIEQSNHIVDDLIHHMYGTAVHIQYNIVAIIFITMNHSIFPFFLC